MGRFACGASGAGERSDWSDSFFLGSERLGVALESEMRIVGKAKSWWVRFEPVAPDPSDQIQYSGHGVSVCYLSTCGGAVRFGQDDDGSWNWMEEKKRVVWRFPQVQVESVVVLFPRENWTNLAVRFDPNEWIAKQIDAGDSGTQYLK